MSKLYFQCEVQQGNARITTWLEQRGALLGAAVELPEEGGYWKVIHVYNNPMSEEQLKEHKKLNRKSLSSIKD